ncbi:MAG: sulfotransferase [Chloroflexota bacterium]
MRVSHLLYRAQRKITLETRRLTAPLRYTPTALVIGAQKGGTSSLHDYLSHHPNALSSYKKEVHFFVPNYQKGHSWYQGHFPLRGQQDKPVVFESSPSYILYADVARRIAQSYPQMKIIALLRHPVHRAYSHYKMNLRLAHINETRSFEEAIQPELNGDFGVPAETGHSYQAEFDHFSYLARGRYWEQLQHWYDVLSPEQILVLQSESLFESPAMVYQEVLKFLGLSSFELDDFPAQNTSGASRNVREKIGDALYNQLLAYFQPYNDTLYQQFAVNYGWD